MTEAMRIDRILRNVRANMRIEGFDFSKETEALCIAVASGERSADEIVRELLRSHRTEQK